mmetsp:Transcript_5692/g.14597  ORF Transcript_5692/g.14597 Transcript_5692/m.14597 type:complete len:217 (-) Transcript_5692:1016-1666(-)
MTAACVASHPVLTIQHPSTSSQYGSWSCAATRSGNPIFRRAISRSSAITWCVIGITTSHPCSSISTFFSRSAVSYTGVAVSIAPPNAPTRYKLLSIVSSPMIPILRFCPPASISRIRYSGSAGSVKPGMLLLIHSPLNSPIRSRSASIGMSFSWFPKHTYWIPHPPTLFIMSIIPLPLSSEDSSEGATKSPGSIVMVLGAMLARMRLSRWGNMPSS